MIKDDPQKRPRIAGTSNREGSEPVSGTVYRIFNSEYNLISSHAYQRSV